MKVFGLTGGIATGKSTVTELFRAHGVPVIDADAIAREVVEPGQPALAEIVERFPEALGADGRLDRARLGARIFQSADDRAALNAITHPRIAQRALEHTAALAERGEPLALYDAPLLIENKLHQAMNGVVLVVAPFEVQLARLMARNALTEAQARERIASQLPLDAKRPFATWVIDNGGTREATARQVEAVLAAMRALT